MIHGEILRTHENAVVENHGKSTIINSPFRLSFRLCIHWQAMQREYARVPAPSFLIYYRFQAEPASNHPSSEGAAVRAPQYLSSDTSANDRQTKNCVEETREMAKAEISGLLQQQQAFATLVRFAVVPGKGVGEWLATGKLYTQTDVFTDSVYSFGIFTIIILQVCIESSSFCIFSV